MNFGAPFGLLALLAVPAIVVLHLYRRRLAERRVAGLFLFTGERLVAGAGRQRTHLLRTPSLWLECLAAIALALWLAEPSLGSIGARHVVFVLDDSASMAAAGCRERAIAAVRERVAALGSGDLVTLLRSGPRPDVLLGPRALAAEVGDALATWQPARPGHDPAPVLDLARELAAGGGEVVFVTDHAPPPGCEDVDVLAFGRARPNAAIAGLQRGAAGDGEQLRVRFVGYGVTEVGWTVSAGDRELQRGRTAVGEGKGELALALPPDTGPVRVQLDADALAIDDQAFALPPQRRIVAVADLLPADRREALAIARVLAAQRDVTVVGAVADAQLVLAAEPHPLRPGQVELVVAPGDGERDAWSGPFVVDRAHPWLAGVQLAGVAWGAGRRRLPGQVLVAAGEQALASDEVLDAGRRLWLDLDARLGNFVRAPDWPVLVANVLETCRGEVPGAEPQDVVLGGEARYRRTLRVDGGDREVFLVAPDGTRTPGRGGRTVAWLPTMPGLHRVVGADGSELGTFAVRFVDGGESDLAASASGAWPRQRTGESGDPVARAAFGRRLLALLLLVVVVADWWWLGRGAVGGRPA